MKINSVEIIEDTDKHSFREQIMTAIQCRAVIDIKFAVTPEIETGGYSGGSYSNGEKYYALITFE